MPSCPATITRKTTPEAAPLDAGESSKIDASRAAIHPAIRPSPIAKSPSIFARAGK